MEHHDAPAEQLRYSAYLNWGALSGLALLAVCFLGYLSGLLPAHVPLDQLPGLWSLPAHDFIRATDSPTGWKWAALIREGDFASLSGIALLSGCSVVCLLAVIPIYARRHDQVYVTICALTIAVQIFAASGILTAGH